MKTFIHLSILTLATLTTAVPNPNSFPNRALTLSRSAALHPRNDTPVVNNGVGVARAGGVLNAQAATEANQRDATATRAFSDANVKAANGQCLSIDPTAGDFRENLIPVQLKACDGSAGQKFDVVTKGKHNDQPGQALLVSTATEGCLNFDPRRAAGDQVIMFSCGGRADGEGGVTDSQLFSFTVGKNSLALAPQNEKGATCLVPAGEKLGSAACNGGADQLFSIA